MIKYLPENINRIYMLSEALGKDLLCFFSPIDYGKPPRIRDLMIRVPYPVIEDVLNYIVRNEFLFEFEN